MLKVFWDCVCWAEICHLVSHVCIFAFTDCMGAGTSYFSTEWHMLAYLILITGCSSLLTICALHIIEMYLLLWHLNFWCESTLAWVMNRTEQCTWYLNLFVCGLFLAVVKENITNIYLSDCQTNLLATALMWLEILHDDDDVEINIFGKYWPPVFTVLILIIDQPVWLANIWQLSVISYLRLLCAFLAMCNKYHYNF